ncbi:hypothetical protein J1614_006919 [Plenodomus biglobosus]|nr:hypothetical protein J1614_006919 [Plenodomus biglobosus]
MSFTSLNPQMHISSTKISPFGVDCVKPSKPALSRDQEELNDGLFQYREQCSYASQANASNPRQGNLVLNPIH